MKKTLITLAALAMASVACAADAADVDWTVTTDAVNGTVTYTATFDGAFHIDLGDASIKNGESFTLQVVQTNPTGFVNGYGSVVVSTGNGYYSKPGANDELTIYVGNYTQTADSGVGTNAKLELHTNTWRYNGADYYDYKTSEQTTFSADAPLTLGYSFKYVNADDAENGDNYFTFASLPGSDVYIDNATSSYTHNDIAGSFNFSTLRNDDSNGWLTIPDGMKTTITITKAVPEPTTATLSLLALAGLAARRRRK